MAGLYDDLPEPIASAGSTEDALAGSSEAAPSTTGVVAASSDGDRPRPPGEAAARLLFSLDDLSLYAAMGFLSVREVGGPLPSACRLLRWLRDGWAPWQQVLRPLRRKVSVHIARLHGITSRTLEDLATLVACAEAAALHGFGFTGVGRHSRLLGGVGSYSHFYGVLPMPRVLWSLHSEGLTSWRGVCSMVVDVGFALLPPWHTGRRRQLLPRAVRLHVGISLWLPPDGVEAEHSFPLLYLNVALAEAEAFEAVAADHPGEPALIAANCEAVLFRPGAASVPKGEARSLGGGVVEEWSLRFCFGPGGSYRHSGHGQTDGYCIEACAAGRRRWRPPELCFAPENRDESLHLVLRARRCDGLLD